MSVHEEFWAKLLKKDANAIRQEFEHLWALAGAGGDISQDQAERTLDLLFERSHLDIHDKGLTEHFPTEQGGPWNGLQDIKHLWWVDHATAGVNGWGTVGWFSSKLRTHVRKFKTEEQARAHYGSRRKGAKVYEKDGKWIVTWVGYAGAVTHFVAFVDGTPFMLLKLKHRCWGEPKRNRDGIHIEMVNPMVCRLKGKDWYFWAGKLPQKMLDRGQVPVELDKPFRGATHMMPYTWSQVITDIKLKRLCIAATGRMARERMSDHTDWRASKFDMGPLWPRDLINDAAFGTMPIEEYDFMKYFVVPDNVDDVVSPEELQAIESGIYYFEDADDGVPRDIEDIDSTVETQQALLRLYGVNALPKYGADGDLGPETCRAVRHFQEDWNKNQPSDVIKEDGIPGTQTWSRLEKALAMGQSFRTRAFD